MGPAANPRLFAHTIADEIHQNQVALRGVARTKLAFATDRDGERVGGTVEERSVKEIYIADYDGANQRRVTDQPATEHHAVLVARRARHRLHVVPARVPRHLHLAASTRGRSRTRPRARGSNYLPAWSPDGTRLAFMSTRDGNQEIYVMNRDGSGLRRLTNHPEIDVTPTWSPTGTQIAFTSDRSGSPQIYIVGVDGLGLQQHHRASRTATGRPGRRRPSTRSPTPRGRARATTSRSSTCRPREIRQVTFGEGSNESPAYAPNGRHLAFMSTRSGKQQIWTIARLGKDLRQITRAGNNVMPDWSK